MLNKIGKKSISNSFIFFRNCPINILFNRNNKIISIPAILCQVSSLNSNGNFPISLSPCAASWGTPFGLPLVISKSGKYCQRRAIIITEKMIEEAVQTIMIANELDGYNGMVHLEPLPLSIYLSLSSILLFLVNSRIGDSGVNLASGFMGSGPKFK